MHCHVIEKSNCIWGHCVYDVIDFCVWYHYRYLLTNQSRPRSINDIMPMIGARFYTQLDSAQLRSDVIENELTKVNCFSLVELSWTCILLNCIDLDVEKASNGFSFVISFVYFECSCDACKCTWHSIKCEFVSTRKTYPWILWISM